MVNARNKNVKEKKEKINGIYVSATYLCHSHIIEIIFIITKGIVQFNGYSFQSNKSIRDKKYDHHVYTDIVCNGIQK